MTRYAVNVAVVTGYGRIGLEDSAEELEDGCEPPSEDVMKHDVLCVADVDVPFNVAIEANVKLLFRVFKPKCTMIGLTYSYEKVSVTLRRANGFQLVQRGLSPLVIEKKRLERALVCTVEMML